MNDHPRFPDKMDRDTQLVIADEVDITLAGFPSKRPLAVAITAYAEDLAGFIESDIRTGFRNARSRASQFAPTPPQVRDAIGAACTARRAREAPPPERELPISGEIPPELRHAWREALGGAPSKPSKPQPVVFVNGQPTQPAAPSIGDVLQTVGVKS